MRLPALSFAALVIPLLLAGRPAAAVEGDLLEFVPFAVPSPQDIAYDENDGTFWVTTFLQNEIYHYAADLSEPLEKFSAPFGLNRYLTGAACNSIDHTLLVADSASGHIFEMYLEGPKKGTPTGREIEPQFLPVVNENGKPTPLGMDFDPHGDAGRGSLYVVESLGTLIYELDLDGQDLRHFVHPDDPDGFPGKGAPGTSNHDVTLIFEDDEVSGLYVTGGKKGTSLLRKLDSDGSYTGVSIPLDDAGGTVSGVLRMPFQAPGAPGAVDTYICVVESNARFALLEGGEPDFHQVLDFNCIPSGNEVDLTWSSRQAYDRIEIREGCSILETLPGTATSWHGLFGVDGVHDVTLHAYGGDSVSEPPACRVVAGAGNVLAASSFQGTEGEVWIPLDVTTDGKGLFLVSNNVFSSGKLHAAILVFDSDFALQGSMDVSETFAGPEDYVTGIAYALQEDNPRIYLVNSSQSTVGIFDGVGALVDTFDARLPNLEDDPQADPDYGLIVGMTYDAAGAGGEGSLWVVEIERDHVYEIDLEGSVLRDIPHPYLALETLPPDVPYGVTSSGIALVPWGTEDELYLGGGALRERGQPRIFQALKSTGQPLGGTEIPTTGIAMYGSTGTFTFESFLRDEEPRLAVLTRNGRENWLLELDATSPAVPAPTFLKARQTSHIDQALLEFTNNGPYDSIEVFRDCAKIANVAPAARSYVDLDVSPGYHEYAVRGLRDGAPSAFVKDSVRIGVGAVLEQKIIWPARYPQQLARDPVDGTFVVVGSFQGDERKLHFFDGDLEYLETREVPLESPWQIATLAVRHPQGKDGELYYISWRQPVPQGSAGSEQFFLYAETLAGEPRGQVEIFPPTPSNGFITYPTGLAWIPASDTFLFLERNSKTFVEIGRDGQTIREFPHPDPPFRNFVFALGVAVAPHRGLPAGDPPGTIFFTTSERHDRRVTVAREMTLEGTLTGVSIPLGHVPHSITGIAVDGDELVLVGTDKFPEALRLKAFPRAAESFVRGDSDGSGNVNLTDAIVTLNYLFRGGPEPSCLDAADADDSGKVDLTDGVAVVLMLFVGAGPLPQPYPFPGQDPTPDSLECF